ncbi:MAG: TonB-dependent receptor [Bacteroidia bacterium]|nr:TonB-dependent receptor [Bacteroidia bacterium]
MSKCYLKILYGFLFLSLFSLPSKTFAQKYTISGYVIDEASGEKLLGATVYDAKTKKGGLSNTYGFFSLTLPSDTVELVFSYTGYKTKGMKFLLDKDTLISISLGYLALDQVDIVAENLERKVDQTQMSRVEIPLEQIKKLPALFGEVDVVKALQLMPGVQSGSEGSSGLYVRGGGPDQNLILLDGVPLYYVSHLGGFFSVFNADALSSIQLYKGGFPARYGGRLSSILDVRMKEGNLNKFEGEGSVGIISSKVSVQGPIARGKSSFIISGRRTYVDLFTRPISRLASNGEAAIGYYFYDLNGKANYILSEKDRLYFSFYTGEDRFSGNGGYEFNDPGVSYEEQFKLALGWGNRLGALRWNHIWSDKLFSNLTATYTRYQLRIAAGGESTETRGDSVRKESFDLEYISRIQDLGLKLDFDYYPSPGHEIKFGINSTYHTFEPSTIGVSTAGGGQNLDTSLVSKIDQPIESFVYLEDNIKIGQRISANMGVHAVHYYLNQTHNWSIQPRAALRVGISEDVSFKASYSQMTQFIHLLTNSGVGLPIDLWVPATEKVPAQTSWQVAGGVSASLWNDQFEFSVEGYYKEMNGLITFKEGNNFFFGGAQSGGWEETVETGGTGTTYGLELLLQKKQGKTTGWIGYTLAWNWRQFDNINKGERFPFKYDRRHDVSVVVTHELSPKVNLAATWVFGTGNAITLPTAGFAGLDNPLDPYFQYQGANSPAANIYQSYLYSIYSSISPFQDGVELFENGRNGFRMQAYHRLDLGVNFTKKKRWGERTWSFGVYNAYNRLNPFVYYFQTVFTNEPDGSFSQEQKLRKLTLFPIIPSISYQFKF